MNESLKYVNTSKDFLIFGKKKVRTRITKEALGK